MRPVPATPHSGCRPLGSPCCPAGARLQDLGHIARVVDGAPCQRQRGQPRAAPLERDRLTHGIAVAVVGLACAQRGSTVRVGLGASPDRQRTLDGDSLLDKHGFLQNQPLGTHGVQHTHCSGGQRSIPCGATWLAIGRDDGREQHKVVQFGQAAAGRVQVLRRPGLGRGGRVPASARLRAAAARSAGASATRPAHHPPACMSPIRAFDPAAARPGPQHIRAPAPAGAARLERDQWGWGQRACEASGASCSSMARCSTPVSGASAAAAAMAARAPASVLTSSRLTTTCAQALAAIGFGCAAPPRVCRGRYAPAKRGRQHQGTGLTRLHMPRSTTRVAQYAEHAWPAEPPSEHIAQHAITGSKASPRSPHRAASVGPRSAAASWDEQPRSARGPTCTPAPRSAASAAACAPVRAPRRLVSSRRRAPRRASHAASARPRPPRPPVTR